jgi:hypothetical protein
VNSTLLRVAVAGVWTWNGLGAKVLRLDPRHEQIVAAATRLPTAAAGAATRAIGIAEIALAVWVASARWPLAAAAVQSAALVAMTSLARHRAPRVAPPAGDLARSTAAFLVVAWLCSWRSRS